MISKKKKQVDMHNYSEDDKREQGGYSYQQWLAYTYLGYKESSPQKLTLKKSPAKSEIYDGGTLLATYEENGNIFWLGTPSLPYEIFGRGKDVKKNKKEEFKKIDESYFTVEEVEDAEPTQEQQEQAYLNQRGKMKAKIIKRLEEEGREEDPRFDVFIDDERKTMSAEEIAQWTLENFKNGFNKYGVILALWAKRDMFQKVRDKNRFVLVLNQLIAEDNDKYDEEFNGLNINRLKEEYAPAVKAAIRKEKEAINNMPVQNNGYTVVRIRDEKHIKQYIPYLQLPGSSSQWCITTGSYSNYIDPEAGKAEVFYLLLKDGYKNFKEVPKTNDPKDAYGLSMIAVSVRKDGSIRTATPRDNHGRGGGEGIFTDLELSQIIGKSIYKACPPLSSPIDLLRDVRTKGLEYLKSQNGNRQLMFYGGYMYLIEEKQMVTDTWDSILKFSRVITVRDNPRDRGSDIIGYVLIQKTLAYEGDLDTTNDSTEDFFYGLDLNLNLVYGPTKKGTIYTTIPQVRKIIKGE